jgi:hypothetical protein
MAATTKKETPLEKFGDAFKSVTVSLRARRARACAQRRGGAKTALPAGRSRRRPLFSRAAAARSSLPPSLSLSSSLPLSFPLYLRYSPAAHRSFPRRASALPPLLPLRPAPRSLAPQDLLDKKWEKWSNKVELKSAADGGATYVASLSVDGAKASTSLKRETKEGPVKKFEVTGESEVKAEFIMPVAELAKGAELNFSLADAPRKSGAEKVKANGGVTVLQKDLAAGLDFSLKGADRFGVDVFAVTTYDKALLGVTGAAVVGGKDEVDASKAKASAFTADVLLAYKTGNTLLGVQTDFFKDKGVSAFLFNKVSDDVQMAARVKAPFSRAADSKASASIDFGVAYKQGTSETTAKANNAGVVSVAYSEQINKLAKVTLLGQIDATKYTSTDSQKFAVQVNLVV